MRTLLITTAVALSLLALTGCGRKTVERIDPSEVRDLTEYWNDTDSRLVAEAVIADALTRPWVSDFRTGNDNQKPIVRLSPDEVRVRTNGDVINKDIFLNDIRRAFINSGQVRVVSTRNEASATRDELAEQQEFATEETKHEQKQQQTKPQTIPPTMPRLIEVRAWLGVKRKCEKSKKAPPSVLRSSH